MVIVKKVATGFHKYRNLTNTIMVIQYISWAFWLWSYMEKYKSQ